MCISYISYQVKGQNVNIVNS